MKKYFLRLSAVVCALALSASTKPFTMMTFKLKTKPIAANIVNDPAQWSTFGIYWGDCTGPNQELACKILLDDSETTYYHRINNNEAILNTENYANSQNPKQDYLVITEGLGKYLGGGIYFRIIVTIQPKHYNTSTLQYENANLGANLSWVNSQEIDE
jgi:hypothetical protein